MESIVQINEQCCIQKNNGKLKKQNRCKTCKQLKRNSLKWAFKPRYMSHKIFDNDLAVIRKDEVTLMLSKPAYSGMCILE